MELERGDQRIRLVWCIKGLISEKDRITKEIERFKPDMVALPISPEEMTGLGACVNRKVKEIALSNLETIFAKKMEAFGKVTVPSPFLAQAYILAKKQKIKLKPLDLDEEAFTDFYVKTVSTPDLIIHSMRCRNLQKKRFKAKNPKDFSLEWDAIVSRTGGLKAVERLRETTMARNILLIPKDYKRVLALVEVERYEGVKAHLQSGLDGAKDALDMRGAR